MIQRFGSIYVNGERVTYASDVPVRIDGEAASPKALRIGQLARVVATRQADGTLVTRNIAIASEVSGPIESVKGNELTVLGQKIVASGKESKLRAGTQVAVYGLRRTDGVIVASLVEPRKDATERVTGLVERGPDGLHIGGLKLSGVDPLAGRPARPDRGQREPGRDAGRAHAHRRFLGSRRREPALDRGLCAACRLQPAARFRLGGP